MAGSADFNKKFVTLFVLGIFFTVIFIFFVGWNGLKISQGEHCGVKKHSLYNRIGSDNSSFVLDNVGDYALQSFSVNDSDVVSYHFCLSGEVIGSNGVHLRVINAENKSFGDVYAWNGSSTYCVETFDVDGVVGSDFLGVECVDCSSNDFVVIYKDVLSKPVLQSYYHSGSLFVSADSSLAFWLVSYESCRKAVKFFTGVYFGLLVALIVVGGVWIGHEGFKNFLDDEDA